MVGQSNIYRTYQTCTGFYNFLLLELSESSAETKVSVLQLTVQLIADSFEKSKMSDVLSLSALLEVNKDIHQL